MKIISQALILSVVASTGLRAQAAPTDSTPRVTFGAFIDGYYAWDFGRPVSLDHSFAGGAVFLTQPSRHNEFNLNLAYVEAKLDAPHYRGRIALQAGTSVQSNYAGEPSVGAISGPSLSRMLQEAFVGVHVAPTLWIDGGIFFSHMGMEGWISRDNPTYSRSLVADYSPYYQSGIKATWTPTAKVTAQLDVVNGWQNIAENNQGKGAGVRIDVAATSATTLSYYNLFSDEAGNRLRTFNGIGVKHAQGALTLVGQLDVGTQSKGGTAGSSTWYGWTAMARVQATPLVAVAARLEGYTDDDQVIISTGSVTRGANTIANPSFHGTGASIGVDVTPYARLVWRSEVRACTIAMRCFQTGRRARQRRTTCSSCHHLR